MARGKEDSMRYYEYNIQGQGLLISIKPIGEAAVIPSTGVLGKPEAKQLSVPEARLLSYINPLILDVFERDEILTIDPVSKNKMVPGGWTEERAAAAIIALLRGSKGRTVDTLAQSAVDTLLLKSRAFYNTTAEKRATLSADVATAINELLSKHTKGK